MCKSNWLLLLSLLLIILWTMIVASTMMTVMMKKSTTAFVSSSINNTKSNRIISTVTNDMIGIWGVNALSISVAYHYHHRTGGCHNTKMNQNKNWLLLQKTTGTTTATRTTMMTTTTTTPSIKTYTIPKLHSNHHHCYHKHKATNSDNDETVDNLENATTTTTTTMTSNNNENGKQDDATTTTTTTNDNSNNNNMMQMFVGTTPTSFDDGQCPYEITTPIYYVNDIPHIGHAYTSIACDVIARYMRLSGRDVFFLTGTDEHGQKVEQSARAKQMPPQEFVDQVSMNFKQLMTVLNISNDYFIRTTDIQHKTSVQSFWNTLVDKKYIYLDTYSGWYSVRDECFYTESELINGNAPTGATVEWVAKEQSYFFKLSAFQEQLLQYYNDHPDFIAPETRKNEVVRFVQSGLRDLSISRTSFQWGIPVPNDENHIMYVWVDALMNYISALGYPPDTSTSSSKYDKFWPASLHVVGKDIIRFHAVYWPALLMAANLPIPKRIFAHGWWTKDGQKISKSVGNVIDPMELITKYGVDQTRFYLMADVNFGNDGDYSDKNMIYKINTNLANEYGNLCQRTMSMVYKNCHQAVPTSVGPYTEQDVTLLNKASTLRYHTSVAISKQLIHKYVDVLVNMIYDANKYIDEQAPWVLKKTNPQRMETVLYVIMEVLRYTSILYQPLIPESANKVLDLLTVPANERTFAHLNNEQYNIKFGTPIPMKPEGIFPRIELPTEEFVDA